MTLLTPFLGFAISVEVSIIMRTIHESAGIVHTSNVLTATCMGEAEPIRQDQSSHKMARENDVSCRKVMATEEDIAAFLILQGREAISVRAVAVHQWQVLGRFDHPSFIFWVNIIGLMMFRICCQCRYSNSPWLDSDPPRCQNASCQRRHYKCAHCRERRD